jgi:hypothetical protein
MIPTHENETNTYQTNYQLNLSFGENRENFNMSALTNQLFSPQSLIEINNINDHHEEESHQYISNLPSYSCDSKDLTITNLSENILAGNFFGFNSTQENTSTPYTSTVPSIDYSYLLCLNC